MHSTMMHIAIADDDELHMYAFSKKISEFENCNIIIKATNGKDLIEKIKLNELDKIPDICIIDIAMPVMNGYETVYELKLLYPHMKLIAMSVNKKQYSINTMIKLGVNCFLGKDTAMNVLRDAIYQVFYNNYYYTIDAPKELYESAKHGWLDVPEISKREMQILKFISNNYSYEDIAKKLSISRRTVESHKDHLFLKFNVNSKIALAKVALENEFFTS